jgi:hypothetical protein
MREIRSDQFGPRCHHMPPNMDPRVRHHRHDSATLFDSVLARRLASLIHDRNPGKCGCTAGEYIQWLRDNGLECDEIAIDTYANVPSFATTPHGTVNLIKIEKQYNVAICLDGAEHVSKGSESIFLDNLANHSKDLIVLSWSVPEHQQNDHPNNRTNCYLIYQLWKRGFRLHATATLSLRDHCSLPSLKNTLIVLSKHPAPITLSELRATTKIVIHDVSRLNSGNSSLFAASIGNIVRVAWRLQKAMLRALGLFRLLRYDTRNFMRSKSRRQSSNNTAAQRSLIPICFTCARHFDYVRLALLSLNISASFVSEIFVYMDKKDPFTDAQRELLRSESRYPLHFQVTKYPMAWAGVGVLLNEMHAFRMIAEQMTPDAIVMKFDSDVLFLSDAIFTFVKNSDGGAVGTSIHQIHGGHSNDIQGGCYFIFAKELNAIASQPITGIAMQVSRDIDPKLPEDRVISGLLRRSGAKLIYNNFLYRDEVFEAAHLDNHLLEARLRSIPASASVIHFEGSKFNMRKVAERLLSNLPLF